MDRYTMTVVTTGIICCTAFLITLAWLKLGRRQTAMLPSDVVQRIDIRLSEMQQSFDAVAIEVERISESQRFAAKLLTERGISTDDANAVHQSASGRPAR